ncbi:Signal peptidase I [Rhynchospora pubera]|uniref:Signal peptidase complex catalytic subunit SEC11 n=2 Tax=Rhynchospora pubera TaxID=906938 RepID=A0AAV8CS36_9POAL|nr:Signal peptidase I [Rhynchospora pubera]
MKNPAQTSSYGPAHSSPTSQLKSNSFRRAERDRLREERRSERRQRTSEMGFLGDSIESIRSIPIRQFLTQIVSLGMIVTSALIIWKGMMCMTGSESPVVVVLSGSMEPGFKRGDILFLQMREDPIRTGEIVVFNVDGREIPIVHRVIKVHERQDTGEVDILTKGDNNFGDDRLLYAHGQLWLQQHHIMGRAVGYLPYVGWVTIIMTEKPIIKYLLIGALGLLVITSKD